MPLLQHLKVASNEAAVTKGMIEVRKHNFACANYSNFACANYSDFAVQTTAILLVQTIAAPERRAVLGLARLLSREASTSDTGVWVQDLNMWASACVIFRSSTLENFSGYSDCVLSFIG